MPIRLLILIMAILGLSGCDPALLALVDEVATAPTASGPSAPPTPAPSPTATEKPLPVRPAATNLPEFDVHFLVATGRPEAQALATPEKLRREVDILNAYFVTAEGQRILNFKFKSATLYGDLPAIGCGLAEAVDLPEPDRKTFYKALNACADPRARDKTAILFVVADHYNEAQGFDYLDSFGGRNAGLPFVALDYKRLGHKDTAEEHEMGHAFGLAHVCTPGATGKTDTNIMGSYINCDGSGGNRKLGFTPDQVETILARAEAYQKLFAKNRAED